MEAHATKTAFRRAAEIEIAATVLREKFRKQDADGWTVFEVRFVDADGVPKHVSACGCDPERQIKHGDSVRLWGKWDQSKWGTQFKFSSFTHAKPLGKIGVLKYLEQCSGIGAATASKLWEEYGDNAIEAIQNETESVARRVNVSIEKLMPVANYLRSIDDRRATQVELLGLLAGYGFHRNVAKDAIEKWGNRAAEIIRRNPYALMQFASAGFARTDRLYCNLGLPKNKLKRQVYCGIDALIKEASGSTWLQKSVWLEAVQKKIAGCKVEPEKALRLAIRAKKVRFENGLIAEAAKAKNEVDITRVVAVASEEATAWTALDFASDNFAKLTEHQRAELAAACSANVSMLLGTPGTGKTFTAAALVREAIAKFGEAKVAVIAPTGKAAVRITQALREYQAPIRAKTIHSTLGIGLTQQWKYHGGNPLPFSAIVVDESSMLDAGLMASLLEARAPGTAILFVGDTQQLPPVGHGAPLRDFVEAGVPFGKLAEIRRNSGRIVEVCKEIAEGVFPPFPEVFSPDEGENLRIVNADKSLELLKRCKQVIQCLQADGKDPVWQTQVICPTKKGELATKKVNVMLQGLLNPTGPSIPKCDFRVGDKVINTQNGWFSPDASADPSRAFQDHVVRNEKGEIYAANGEQGRVVAINEKSISIDLAISHAVIKVFRGKIKEVEKDGDEGEEDSGPSTGCSWDLGYAISCHKSQGSEWSVVIGLLDPGPQAKRVMNREWVYTLISRAKWGCFLIGSHKTAESAARVTGISQRKTMLVKRMRERMPHAKTQETTEAATTCES